MINDPSKEKSPDKYPIKINLDAEERIKAEALRKGVRINIFFQDFDKLRKGTVNPEHVNLNSLSLVLEI